MKRFFSGGAIAEGASLILHGIGEDLQREGLLKTPDRVARAWAEMTRGYDEDPADILGTTFTEQYDEMVVVAPIEFYSLCEHHLLPFHGTARVGYIPNGRVVGLSKIARLVQCFARRVQVQERMTKQIAQALDGVLHPRGVGVVIRASHLCMAARGVRSASIMTTSSLSGAMKKAESRSEFLALARA